MEYALHANDRQALLSGRPGGALFTGDTQMFTLPSIGSHCQFSIVLREIDPPDRFDSDSTHWRSSGVTCDDLISRPENPDINSPSRHLLALSSDDLCF